MKFRNILDNEYFLTINFQIFDYQYFKILF